MGHEPCSTAAACRPLRHHLPTAEFGRRQEPRRVLAKQSDEVTRQDLEAAASFIEREMEAIGPSPDRYVAFIGD